MNLLSILLQAPATGGSQWSGILMMVVIIAIFYFFMIRPQQKRQKEIQKAREALKTGDKVITAGGIYGRISAIHICRLRSLIAYISGWIKRLFSLRRKMPLSNKNNRSYNVTT